MVEATMGTRAAVAGGWVRYATPRGRWVLGVAVLGSAIAFLEATVTNVALPTIARDLGTGVSGLQWVLNGYLLTLAALILLAALRRIPETRDPTVHGRVDVAGSLLAALGLGGLTFALIQGSAGLA